MLGSIVAAVLKALMDFFHQSREADKNRNQLETLARQSERSRVELQKARKNLDVQNQRQTIDETVRNLDDTAALDKLRASVRKPSGPAA